MTVSKDGFIADKNDETPWSDASWEAFQAFVLSCDIILLGRRTFEIMQRDDEFIAGPVYIVATRQEDFDAGDYKTVNITSAAMMPQADKVGIIGGGDLNGQLANLGVIDEMYLDIEPIELHEGIRLFGTREPELKLEPLDSKELGEGTVQRHYAVH